MADIQRAGMVILAAVDGESAPDQAVSIGFELATAHDEELVVVHVMPQAEYEERHEASELRSTSREVFSPPARLAPGVNYRSESAWSNESVYRIDDAQEDAAGIARDVAEATLEDPSGVVYQGRVGHLAEEIIAEADRREARYVVVGGRRRNPVGKAVFGSVTQDVILGANQPVMTVLPGLED